MVPKSLWITLTLALLLSPHASSISAKSFRGAISLAAQGKDRIQQGGRRRLERAGEFSPGKELEVGINLESFRLKSNQLPESSSGDEEYMHGEEEKENESRE